MARNPIPIRTVHRYQPALLAQFDRNKNRASTIRGGRAYGACLHLTSPMVRVCKPKPIGGTPTAPWNLRRRARSVPLVLVPTGLEAGTSFASSDLNRSESACRNIDCQRQQRDVEEKRDDGVDRNRVADRPAGDGHVRYLVGHPDHEREVDEIPIVGLLEVAGKQEAATFAAVLVI